MVQLRCHGSSLTTSFRCPSGEKWGKRPQFQTCEKSKVNTNSEEICLVFILNLSDFKRILSLPASFPAGKCHSHHVDFLCQKIEDNRDVIEGKEVITVHQWPCDSIQAAIGGYRDIWNLHFWLLRWSWFVNKCWVLPVTVTNEGLYGFPTKNVIILVVTVTGQGDNPK